MSIENGVERAAQQAVASDGPPCLLRRQGGPRQNGELLGGRPHNAHMLISAACVPMWVYRARLQPANLLDTTLAHCCHGTPITHSIGFLRKKMKPGIPILLAGLLFSFATLAAPQELANEEWVLKPNEVHRLPVSLNKSSAVSIEATGVKNTDKGFTMGVVRTEDLDACAKAVKSCNGVAGFEVRSVRDFSKTVTVPAGRWTFFVANTENIINRASVHVHVVVDTKTN